MVLLDNVQFRRGRGWVTPHGKGTKLLINISKQLKADTYPTFSIAKKYLDLETFNQNGIQIKLTSFYSPAYPQLKFICNLSALDMLLNCRPKSLEIISKT